MRASTLLALLVAFAATAASAQEKWGFEVRGGAAVPTQDVGSDELGTGFGLEGTLRYQVQDHLAVYAGWDWIRFSPDSGLGGSDVDLEETGYAFGLRFEHPFSAEEGPVGWWVRAGGIYDHLETENSDGEIIDDSGHGFGFEAGAGLALATGGAWSILPGVRYRSLSRDIDLRYLMLELGVAWLF